MMGIMRCQETIYSTLEKSDTETNMTNLSTVSDVQLKLKACSTI